MRLFSSWFVETVRLVSNGSSLVSFPACFVSFFLSTLCRYTCSEKAAYARTQGNVFRLDRYLKSDKKDKDGWVTADDSLGFLGARPRWYYFFLMNCKPDNCADKRGWCQGPVEAEYSLLMTNGVGYMKHFSADEVGILPTAITFGTFYILLTLYTLSCIVKPLLEKHKLHWTVIMYIISLLCYTVSMWFDTADLASEGDNGTR